MVDSELVDKVVNRSQRTEQFHRFGIFKVGVHNPDEGPVDLKRRQDGLFVKIDNLSH